MENVFRITANKGLARTVATVLLMLLMLSLFAPTMAFADDPVIPVTGAKGAPEAQGLNDFTVTMDDSTGKLAYGGMGKQTWTEIIAKYRMFIIGGTGIATVTLVGAFVISLTKLGASAGNPQARSQAITACLWTGIASALLGSATVIIGFFFNSLA